MRKLIGDRIETIGTARASIAECRKVIRECQRENLKIMKRGEKPYRSNKTLIEMAQNQIDEAEWILAVLRNREARS